MEISFFGLCPKMRTVLARKKRNFRVRKLGAAIVRDVNALGPLLVLNVFKRKRVVTYVQKRVHFSNGFCMRCVRDVYAKSCMIVMCDFSSKK